MIRSYRILWAARLLAWATRIYPGDIRDIHSDIAEGIAAAEAGIRETSR